MTISTRIKKSLIIFPIAGTILFSSIGVQAELGDSVLKEGVTNEDVQVLQEHLIDLNFLNIDETTTYYGEKTIQAVKEFQHFYGLKEDGSFGPNTFETLKKVSEINSLEYNRTLEFGIEGEDVKDLKERLNIMGFLADDYVDPSYGPKTKEAVSNFQKAYKLQVDGKAGPSTIEAINKALNGNRRMKRPMASRGGLGTRNNNIISTAKKYMGTPYRYGGTSSAGFDCSGFTQFVYKQHGVSVPRSTSGQATAGTKLGKGDLRTGDLVIFSNTYKAGPSHAGIYIGNGDFIHSSSSKGVTISNLSDNYYANRFSYGRRVY